MLMKLWKVKPQDFNPIWLELQLNIDGLLNWSTPISKIGKSLILLFRSLKFHSSPKFSPPSYSYTTNFTEEFHKITLHSSPSTKESHQSTSLSQAEIQTKIDQIQKELPQLVMEKSTPSETTNFSSFFYGNSGPPSPSLLPYLQNKLFKWFKVTDSFLKDNKKFVQQWSDMTHAAILYFTQAKSFVKAESYMESSNVSLFVDRERKMIKGLMQSRFTHLNRCCIIKTEGKNLVWMECICPSG